MISTLFAMLPTFFYAAATIITLFFLGFGLSFFLPQKLKQHCFWLSPWLAIIWLIICLIIFSLLGFSVKQVSPFLIVFLTGLNCWVFFKAKFRPKINLKKTTLVVLVMTMSLVFNLSPLIKRDKFLTSVSMGNCDVIVYAITPDYLVDHSMAESFQRFFDRGINGMLTDNYRWGTPMLPAFFLNLFNLQGYQYAYLCQVILFALTLCLVYVFLEIINPASLLGLGLGLAIFSFNANLLYMLYHNFFGQVLFWGLQLLLLILFFAYFSSPEEKVKKLNRYDLAIGLTSVALFFSYHEAAVFMFTPLLIFFILRVLLKQKPLVYFKTLLKIALIALVLGSISIFNAFMIDFLQIQPNDNPVGWELFRAKLPYANPFEMMGFYSIHSFPPLPLFLAIPLSLGVCCLICYGISKSKKTLLATSFLITYLLFYFWMIKINFFSYNRAVTYTLPFLLIFFTSGLDVLIKKHKRIKTAIVIVLIGLEFIAAIKLNRRFIWERASIGHDYISLQQIDVNQLDEPVYPEEYLDKYYTFSYWKKIWTDYFFYNRKPTLREEVTPDKDGNFTLPQDALVLISKPTPWYRPMRLLFEEIVWENEYYQVGRLCHTQECLLNHSADLSQIIFGKSEFEDSLVLTGWDKPDTASRWANNKEAKIKLVIKENQFFKKLIIRAESLKEPQQLKIYFNNQLLGEQVIKLGWNDYQFLLNKRLQRGVYEIRLEHAEIYRLGEVLNNQDERMVTINYNKIKLSP